MIGIYTNIGGVFTFEVGYHEIPYTDLLMDMVMILLGEDVYKTFSQSMLGDMAWVREAMHARRPKPKVRLAETWDWMIITEFVKKTDGTFDTYGCSRIAEMLKKYAKRLHPTFKTIQKAFAKAAKGKGQVVYSNKPLDKKGKETSPEESEESSAEESEESESEEEKPPKKTKVEQSEE